MKKTILYFLTLLAAGMLAGCLDNFDEYNRNPNETTDDELNNDNYLVGSKITGMQNNVVPTEEHLYQFSEILVGDAHAHYGGSTPEWTNRFETGNPPTNWVKAVFVDPITNLYTYYRGIVSRSDNEVILALADVLRVASMHRLTDQFGPIPYTKIAENGGEELTTAYDDQQAVYTAMFGELDAALAVFEANTGLSSEALADYDMVYYGDISKWMKFTNSLKLRMAMRLSYIAPDVARSKAAEAIAAGVITANADNAEFHPVLNRLAMIWNEWQDHVVGADILSYMNGYEDPRREKMFTTVAVTETIPDPDTGQPVEITRQVYQGIRIGVMPASAQAAKTQCSFPLITEQSPVKWLCAAETAFLMSEYQLRWGTMSEAGALYEKGVALSFEECDAQTCGLCRSAQRRTRLRGPKHHHARVERRGYAGDGAGAHHYAEIHRPVPARQRGVGRIPAHGIPASDAHSGRLRQVGRHDYAPLRRPPRPVPRRGVCREQGQRRSGRADARRRGQCRNPPVVGLQTIKLTAL